MDLKAWKEKVYERLWEWRPRMEAWEAKSVYGFLSATTLWPVLQAAQQNDMAALIAFGSVAGGVGDNLIANRLQAWKDTYVSEEAAVQGITKELKKDAELRQVLDNVLGKLEVFELAAERLSEEEDKAWFAETLQTELARLGNLQRHHAMLTNVTDSIVVQGDGNTVIKGGHTAVGKVETSRDAFIGGEHHHFTTTDEETANTGEVLRQYAANVAKRCRHLLLRGLDVGHSDPTSSTKKLALHQVYVALNSTSRVSEDEHARLGMPEHGIDERPLRLLEAVVGHPRLVVLGDPGSGKSTFINHLALCLSAHRIEPEEGWLEHLPHWPKPTLDEPLPLPILVVLRDFAHWLSARRVEVPSKPKYLWDFIRESLDSQNLSKATAPLHEVIEKGQVILLLDGLDEIPTQVQRTHVRHATAAFLSRYDIGRVIVTCRTLSYQDPQLKLKDLPTTNIAPFDEEQIDRFIEAWYEEIGSGSAVQGLPADAMVQRLKEAVRRSDLQHLASNPLLLTVMALVHTHKGRLPAARALLYEETIDILLWRWEYIKSIGQNEPLLRRLLNEAGLADVDLKRSLWQLAYQVHTSGGSLKQEGLADINEDHLERILAKAHPDGSLKWAQRVVNMMKLRAGLLLERAPEVYSFPHRTFQEYMAASHLASRSTTFASDAAKLATEQTLWREVILLAVGKKVYLGGDVDAPVHLAAKLCPASKPINEEEWRNAWLAGDVLVEIGRQRVEESDHHSKEVLDRVRERLVQLLRGNHLQPRERAAAGATLGRLGDPREDVTTIEHMQFCYVPSGSCNLGEHDDERPYEGLQESYWISHFPVTQKQYQAFIKDGGYNKQCYWTNEGWRWCRDTDRHSPEAYGEPFSLPNHPVVGVTWHEAYAFTRWLAEYIQQQGWINHAWQIDLPSEIEWEKAARGGFECPYPPLYAEVRGGLDQQQSPSLQTNPAPHRRSPWGDGFHKDHSEFSNYIETGVGATSAVGCFPAGASPCGPEEMSGNVLEWTRSLWRKDYPYAGRGNEHKDREDVEASGIRVVRGGAFSNRDRHIRCAFRHGNFPHDYGNNMGFRVVTRPNSDP